jgi:hypothetical protein
MEHEDTNMPPAKEPGRQNTGNRRELDEVFAFGKQHAKMRGLRPDDVAKAIAEVRASEQRGQ